MRLFGRASSCLFAMLAGAVLWASEAQGKSFYVTPAGKDSWLVIDPLTAENQPGGVVRRMWSVTVQRSMVQGGPPQPGYVRTQTDYDCLNKQVRWRTFSAYSRNGGLLVTRDNNNLAWTEATSAPDIYAAFRIACEGAANSAISAESIGRLVITLMASWDAPETAPAAPAPLLPAPGAKGAVPTAKAATPAKPAPGAAAKPAPAKPPAAKPAAAKPKTT